MGLADLFKIEFTRKGKVATPPESGGVAHLMMGAGVGPEPKRIGNGTTPRVIALAAL